MKPGEPFNPWRGNMDSPGCGFYPPEVVGRQRSLGDGPKRVYERLVRYAGRNGQCFPSQPTLAAELGKCERQVRNDLKTLEQARLIEHRDRGRCSNSYVFLWHEMFGDYLESQTSASADEDLSGSPLPNNRGVVRQDTVVCEAGYGNLSGSPLPPNSVQEYKHKKSVQGEGLLATNLFEEFRQRYPEPKRSVKVESACRAYVGRIHGTPGEHQKLMAGLLRYIASSNWQRALSDDPTGRFIPTMERFITDGAYLDHPPAAHEEPNDGYFSEEEANRRRAVEMAQMEAYV